MAPKKEPGKQPAKPPTPTPVQRGRQGYSVGSKGGSKGAKPAKGAKTGSTGGGSSNRLWWVIGGVAVLVGIGVVAFFALRGSDDAFASGLEAAGCTDTTYPDQGRTHLEEGAPDPEYNSDPPTSGDHQPTPALWGIYTQPVAQDILVHNLEHGGLVVQYGDQVPAETVTEIRDNILEDRDLTVLAPYPALGNKIAYTLWTRGVTCTGFDTRVIDGLREKRNQPPAPEVPQDPSFNRQPNF